MEELCPKILENKKIRALVVQGREGPIGRVIDDPYKGVIALFSEKTPKIGETVILYDYAERESKSGKLYLRVFNWATEKEFNELLKRCRELTVNLKRKKILEATPDDLKDIVEMMLNGTMPSSKLPEHVDFIAVAPVQEPEHHSYLAIGIDGQLIQVSYWRDPVLFYSSKPYLEIDCSDFPFIRGARVYSLNTEYGEKCVLFGPEKIMTKIRAIRKLKELDLPIEIEEKVKEKILGGE